jgi:DNA-directed RNA polymerase specialized sigma subunit
MNGVLKMSKKEADRLTIISLIYSDELTIKERCEILGISERQTYRIIKRISVEGSKGIIDKIQSL